MPNWCTNYVTITHSEAQPLLDLMAKIDRAKGAEDIEDGFFQQIIPMPLELANEELCRWGGSDEEVEHQNARRAVMLDKYGYSSWYGWRVDKWGTKWDVRGININESDPPDNSTLDLQFETAWSPPLGIYEALKEQGFHVRAEYIDEGMGFVGEWVDGDDFCYNKQEDVPDHLSHLWPDYEECE